MKTKIIIFLVCASVVLVIKAFLFSNAAKTKFEVIDYGLVAGKSCGRILDPTHIVLGTSVCKSIGFSYELKSLPLRPLWIRASVKSSNYRSGLHILVNGVWQYSYHSGDGAEQVLYTKIDKPEKTIEFILMASEVDANPPELEFGPIVISGVGETDLGHYSAMSHSWMRTNDPNKDFWFDRYTSPMQNFTVTLANPRSQIWERYFGIGVNDAANSGDYFCYPDDKLLFVQNGRPKWFYLGALTWTRNVHLEGPKLMVAFEYEGPLKSGDHMVQEHALAILRQNFLVAPSDLPVMVKLRKEYTFDLREAKMEVRVNSGFLKHNLGTPYWIVEDGPYMEFEGSNQLNVHSLIGATADQQGFYSNYEKDKKLPRIVLFRLRDPALKSVAATYSSSDNHLTFLNDNYLAHYLDQHPELYRSLEEERPVSMGEPNRKNWFFGIGFNLRKTPQFSFAGRFLSHFKNIEELEAKLAKIDK